MAKEGDRYSTDTERWVF